MKSPSSRDDRPLVSAIVASYNHAGFLRQRMESLVAQTYPNLEILVIDDCSTDNSRDLLAGFATDSRVRIVNHGKNAGWVRVSNEGVDSTTGKYLLFANCDDYCDLRQIETLVEMLEAAPNAGVAFTRSDIVDERGKVLASDFTYREPHFQERCRERTIISGREMQRFFLHACVIPNLSAALIRRECFERVGAFSLAFRVCCDWDFFFRVAPLFDFVYDPLPLNSFRQHRTSIRSSTRSRVVIEEYIRLLHEQIPMAGLSRWREQKALLHIATLWAAHIIDEPATGLGNLPFHLRCTRRYQRNAMAYLFAGLTLRIVQLALWKMGSSAWTAF